MRVGEQNLSSATHLHEVLQQLRSEQHAENFVDIFYLFLSWVLNGASFSRAFYFFSRSNRRVPQCSPSLFGPFCASLGWPRCSSRAKRRRL